MPYTMFVMFLFLVGIWNLLYIFYHFNISNGVCFRNNVVSAYTSKWFKVFKYKVCLTGPLEN
jgi:hypothetical protein